MMEISRVYQTRNPGSTAIIESGTPAELTGKLKAGASGDVIIGDEKFISSVADLIDVSTRVTPFSNATVAITNEDSEIDWKKPSDITKENMKKIAALKATSPLGKNVRAYLDKLGLKDTLADKLVEAKSPKEAIEKIKAGEAKWAILYSTDVSRRKVKKLFIIPPTDIHEISYSMAMLSRSQQKEDANKFLQAMQSVIAQKFFENAGFVWKLQRAPEPQSKPAKAKKKKERDP
jgi:molybdate transport system substrate-binding protein